MHSGNLRHVGNQKESASDLLRIIVEPKRDVVAHLVLHHLCWADDLYAMAGTVGHLTRILGNRTNSIEQLGMQWKEKSLTVVAGPYTEYMTGDVVEFISNKGRRWVWRVVEGMEALGTLLDSRGLATQKPASGTEAPCSSRTRFFCVIRNFLSRGVFTPFVRRVLLRCFMVLVNGHTHSPCFRHCAFGNLANFDVCCACAAGRKNLGRIR